MYKSQYCITIFNKVRPRHFQLECPSCSVREPPATKASAQNTMGTQDKTFLSSSQFHRASISNNEYKLVSAIITMKRPRTTF